MLVLMRNGILIRFNVDRSKNVREDEIRGHGNV